MMLTLDWPTTDLEHQPLDAFEVGWKFVDRDLAFAIIPIDKVKDDCARLNRSAMNAFIFVRTLTSQSLTPVLGSSIVGSLPLGLRLMYGSCLASKSSSITRCSNGIPSSLRMIITFLWAFVNRPPHSYIEKRM